MTRAPNVDAIITDAVFATPNCKEQLLGNGPDMASCDCCDYCQADWDLSAQRNLRQSIPLISDTHIFPSPFSLLHFASDCNPFDDGLCCATYLPAVSCNTALSSSHCIYPDEARVLLSTGNNCHGFTYQLNLKISQTHHNLVEGLLSDPFVDNNSQSMLRITQNRKVFEQWSHRWHSKVLSMRCV